MRTLMVFFLSWLCFSSFSILSACNTEKPTSTIYEQLCELNKYWDLQTGYKDLLNQKVVFENHDDLIQLHLQLVEQHLQRKEVAHLSIGQKQNRAQALKVLKAYGQQKQFPKNTQHTDFIPYFIDDFNTACAVGHLMRESGALEEVHWIAEMMNNAYIEDMPIEKLQQWADKMGFEVEELKWIQPVYPMFIEEELTHTECGMDNGSVSTEITVLGYCFETEYDPLVWYDHTGSHIKRIGTGRNLKHLSSGFYRYQVEAEMFGFELSECQKSRYFGIDDQGSAEIQSFVEVPSGGESNGVIHLNVINGTPPYSYEWHDFHGNYLGDASKLENLKGYYYTPLFDLQPPDFTHRVKVTDAAGCTVFKKFYLEDDTEGYTHHPLFTPYIENTIPGQATGRIVLDRYPSSNFTYRWAHNFLLTSHEASNLRLGDYTVRITDTETEAVYVRHFTILDRADEFTDIAEKQTGNLNLYPTLATQNVRIELPFKSQNYSIEVFDHNGRKMESNQLVNPHKTHSLKVENYPKGMYFVTLRNGEESYVGRFLKQ